MHQEIRSAHVTNLTQSAALPDTAAHSSSERSSRALSTSLSNRMSVEEVARRLTIGHRAVHKLLERTIRPKNNSQSGKQYFLVDRHKSGSTRLWPPV
jgi:hypothetical protein